MESLTRRKNTFEKKQVLSRFCWVAGQPDFCLSWSFILLGPVQSSSRPNPGLTHWTDIDLITMISCC